MSEPTTEAGRDQLARLRRAFDGDHHGASEQWRQGVAAAAADIQATLTTIEAEARVAFALQIEARVRNECRYAADLELCPECAGVVLALREEAAR